jgi:hypothetical protein
MKMNGMDMRIAFLALGLSLFAISTAQAQKAAGVSHLG